MEAGRKLWRSLDEFAGDEECASWLNAEFPTPIEAVDRRQFMKIMGASFALAGLGACSKLPQEQIVPYIEDPRGLTVGRPLHFATALLRNGYATGVVVESREGRPTKIEGNSQHPSSLGSAGVFEQASLQSLYDPDRSQTVLNRGEIQNWEVFLDRLSAEMRTLKASQGKGFHVLSESYSSPTLADQFAQMRMRFPEAKWYQWDAASRFNVQEGCRLAFGTPFEPQYDFSAADVVIALDSDFLLEEPDHLRLARMFGRRRSYEDPKGTKPVRLYVAESTMTITGSMADRRLPVSPSKIGSLVAQISEKLGVPGEALSHGTSSLSSEVQAWIGEVITRAKEAGARSFFVAGPRQSAAVHAALHRINALLGSANTAIHYVPPATGPISNPVQDIQQLCAALEKDMVSCLLVCGGDPIVTAPRSFKLAERLRQARFSVYWGEYVNATAKSCIWHIPAAHSLETWSDARAADGTISLLQPLIAPLYNGRSLHELLAAFLDDFSSRDYELVRQYWQRHGQWQDFERSWNAALHDGQVPNTAAAPATVSSASSPLPALPAAGDQSQIEISFHLDPSLWDGRYANSAWLQELPRPTSKLCWDNPALISAELAHKSGLSNGDLVELKAGDRKLEIAVWIQPGQAPNVVSLWLNPGRQPHGRVSRLTGFATYELRGIEDLWSRSDCQIRKLGRSYQLVSTQMHHAMEGREPVRLVDESELKAGKTVSAPEEDKELINPAEQLTAPLQWGMVINLNACIGCNACMIACQAENNISVVGKDQVWRGREMHWIRVDSYFEGDPTNPSVHHQPVPCMHCETAPCELVCPVEATLHSSEGLNQQVYNRCIGTRFCSNNCPYKVRRFNFLQYADLKTPAPQLLWNPEVTVRTRGIMEKCTYCVQRIRNAEINAEVEHRSLGPDEVVPACAQACPTEAIVFGDLKNPSGHAARLKTSPLNYALLGDLNTRPRTTYLAKVKSANAQPISAA
jgi:MoCo/4Fe-4S cofactor protein with predicted Tat translocation signal